MALLFGYMVFMIILKWCINWSEEMAQGNTPPSIISTMIDIILDPGENIYKTFA